jgi:hypothetical protein
MILFLTPAGDLKEKSDAVPKNQEHNTVMVAAKFPSSARDDTRRFCLECAVCQPHVVNKN